MTNIYLKNITEDFLDWVAPWCVREFLNVKKKDIEALCDNWWKLLGEKKEINMYEVNDEKLIDVLKLHNIEVNWWLFERLSAYIDNFLDDDIYFDISSEQRKKLISDKIISRYTITDQINMLRRKMVQLLPEDDELKECDEFIEKCLKWE